MRVLFHVQHLLGVGHLRRGELLADAMRAAGMEVTVALGGEPVPAMPFSSATVVQLPPARLKGADFTTLLDEHGAPVTDAWRAARRDALLALYEETAPDIVLLEMFPFGRRRLSFELLPLMKAARADPRGVKVVTSVRDILVEAKRPERAREAALVAREHLDAVLVHADPTLFTFGETYPHADELEDLIAYTGYVTEPGARTRGAPNGEVLVSAGGGAAAGDLMRAALAARPLTALKDHVWRFLTGPRYPQDEFEALAALADERTIVERFSPRFQALMDGAALSISQAGYNTVMNVLQSGARAVVVPYDEGEETEQRFRSDRMEAMGLLSVVTSSELGGETLAAAIAAALARDEGARPSIDLSGAARTARLLRDLCADLEPSRLGKAAS
ncbi:glycosyltransferase [Aurantimonas sp. Leaf443]|uniref:glycosyltransferase family protein n=1 Tax=Aurantimonas sp. Leaf443 TaxID=1736378 RepID=UPI000700215E|nr:glycosyltransferase [Aurantimonas sp. Leaf443]KQT86127.1 hypothetical protein ASG48_05990 [Aurantimonas sp. Leaf443]